MSFPCIDLKTLGMIMQRTSFESNIFRSSRDTLCDDVEVKDGKFLDY